MRVAVAAIVCFFKFRSVPAKKPIGGCSARGRTRAVALAGGWKHRCLEIVQKRSPLGARGGRPPRALPIKRFRARLTASSIWPLISRPRLVIISPRMLRGVLLLYNDDMKLMAFLRSIVYLLLSLSLRREGISTSIWYEEKKNENGVVGVVVIIIIYVYYYIMKSARIII